MASSRALTSTNSLMKLFSPMKASPILARAIHIPVHSDSESKETDSKQTPTDSKAACPLVNPFLKEGPAYPFKVMNENEGMYARLDMPGIGKEGLKLWFEDNSLHVKGEEDMYEDDVDVVMKDGPRKVYSGDINLPQGRYNVEEIEAELKNGVLKVKVPKLKVEERKNVVNIKVK